MIDLKAINWTHLALQVLMAAVTIAASFTAGVHHERARQQGGCATCPASLCSKEGKP